MSRSEHLLLPRQLYSAMIQHAQTELPNECCGLLAGVRGSATLCVEAWHPLVNELASPTRYRAEGASMCKAHRAMREAGHEILAVYHSHPTSAPIPSATDLEWAEYHVDEVFLIIGLSGPEPHVRGWWLTETTFDEADWRIVEA